MKTIKNIKDQGSSSSSNNNNALLYSHKTGRGSSTVRSSHRARYSTYKRPLIREGCLRTRWECPETATISCRLNRTNRLLMLLGRPCQGLKLLLGLKVQLSTFRNQIITLKFHISTNWCNSSKTSINKMSQETSLIIISNNNNLRQSKTKSSKISLS